MSEVTISINGQSKTVTVQDGTNAEMMKAALEQLYPESKKSPFSYTPLKENQRYERLRGI
jgi:hypothetical protein